ncbi:MAG: hypothetical protein KTR25_00655 [Myxococcales bacterium]|nr:hypothetical protein [Myxococcales bacterium]
MRTLVSLMAFFATLGTTMYSPRAWAVPVVRQLAGLDEFWKAFQTLKLRPDRLSGQRFKIQYVGEMDSGERLRLYLDPPDAFSVQRLDRRTYLVIIRRPYLLFEQDFVREIGVRASLESRARYSAPGTGYCTLAVRFHSDVGRVIRLARYDAVEVEWSPKEAAVKLHEERDHVLFRRTEGHSRTSVEVRAKVFLRDGSTRTTEPVTLGYCDGINSETNNRVGIEVSGGGAVTGEVRPAWDIGVPFEIRADPRLHIRLGPSLTWQPDFAIGLVGQVGLGYRVGDDVGFRVGGEVGWVRLNRLNNPIELDVMRAAGSFGLMWSLSRISGAEIGMRVRVGTIADDAFGDVSLNLSWLPISL